MVVAQTLSYNFAMAVDDSMDRHSDEAVIRRVRGGDIDEFEVLIERHKRHVFAIVANHVPGDRVGEIAHEVFVNAFQSLDSWAARSPFEHWLARIAVRRCYDFWRAQGRSRETAASSLSDGQRDWIESVLAAPSLEAFEMQVVRDEARECVQWALAQLPADDRMVVTLVNLEGYAVKDAADLLGWSAAKVKVRALRARRALRGVIERMIARES
jgi:RNA polymerase sigma-70 factor (ECF subfamily)